MSQGASPNLGRGKLVMALLVLACAAPAPALDPHKAITQYIETAWTTESGLPQTSVYSIAQTSDGYLWVGTELGLARFDGARFTVFNQRNTPALPANYISRLLAARDGGLWVGTNSGLAHLKNGAWTSYSETRGLSDNDVRALFESSDGSLWVGTGNGLDRLHDGKTRIYGTADGLPGAAIVDLKGDPAAGLWIATAAGLAHFDGARFTAFKSLNDLSSDSLSALAVATDGSVWVAAAHGKLARIVQGRLVTHRETRVDSDILALMLDRDNNLWIGFENRGLARLHDGVLAYFSSAKGLPGETVETFFEDADHDLWIGLFDGGLVQLRDGAFTTYGRPEGFSSNIGWCGLQARDGAIWMATTTGGLDRLFPSGAIRKYTHEERKSAEVAHSILEANDGTIWIGQRHGVLTRFQNGQFTTYRYAPAAQHAINSLAVDRGGSLLIGTYGAGAARFKNGRFEPIVPSGAITSIVASADGSLWLGTDGDGVVRLENGIRTAFTTSNGLLSNHIIALDADRDGVLWVGSSSGLTRIENGVVASWSQNAGLYDSTVGNILEDNFGNLWMASDNGVFRVSKDDLNGFANHRISSLHSVFYDTADGLRSRETMQGGTGTASKGSDGRLWFSTMSGLAVVDPGRALDAALPLRVGIESASVDGKPIDMAQSIRLGIRSARLEIRFTAPSFAAVRRIQFRYRLDGFDRDWSSPALKRAAEYTNLPPGRYRFLVQASRDGNQWYTSVGALDFAVMPPWYSTVWAYLAYLLAAFLLTWAIVALRTRGLVRHRRLLKRLVAERTAQLEVEKQDLMTARASLEFQAAHDSLTGLWSRGAILDQLARELDRANREHSTLSIVVGDLDHFKSVNDNHGHLCGDFVLREAAHRLQSLMRGYDAVGRYGGEEFLILLPGYDALKSPARAQELVDAIASRPIDFSGQSIHITSSFGVALTKPWLDLLSMDELIRRADQALYRAKHMGRNRVEFDRSAAPVISRN